MSERWLHRCAAVAAVLLTVLVLVRIADARFQYIIWTDRDLWRSARVFQDWPVSGAELSYANGARVPGGFWHWLIAPAVLWRGDPEDVQRFLLVLDGLAAGALGWLVARQHGVAAGVLAASFFALDTEVRRTLTWLWNPSALPLFLVASQVALVDLLQTGRRRSWFAWAFVLALGAHAHMTALGWFTSTGIALVVLRPREALRAAPAVFAAFVLAYLPYILSEAAHGWPNSHAMMEIAAVKRVEQGRPWGFQVDELVQILHMFQLSPTDAPKTVVPAVEAAGLGVVALALLTGLGALRPGAPDPGRDALRVLFVGLLANILAPVVDPAVKVENRYAFAALPAFATLAAVGTVQAAAWLRAPVAGPSAALALTGALSLAQLVWWPRDGDTSFQDWDVRKEALQTLEPSLGGLAGTAARTVFAERAEGGWRRMKTTPIDFLLAQRGEAFPGALPPPCAMVFGADTIDDPAAEISALLGVDPSTITIHRSFSVKGVTQGYVYTPAQELCPTTCVDRYVELDRERDLRQLWGTLADGEVAPLPGENGRAAHFVTDPDHALSVGLYLEPSAGEVRATLVSNQLRGGAYNGDWFSDALASNVRLRFEGAQTLEFPLADTPVGLSGVVTPLSKVLQVPPGKWRVSALLTLHSLDEQARFWPFAIGAGVPREVVMLDELLVP